jgi:hypothetical protein
MRERIKAALRASKADYTEIRLEERESSRVVFRGGAGDRQSGPGPGRDRALPGAGRRLGSRHL